MRAGDQVVHLHAPWTYGMGTVVGINEISWVEVEWASGDVGAYPAQHLEHAEVWEREQVERLTRQA